MMDLAFGIAEFIDDARTGAFDELILRLFERQYRECAAYRAYCDNSGAVPSSVMTWRDIPAIPARAFKLTELSCAPLDAVTAVFHSSGTTEGNHSTHYLDALAERLYRLSLRRGYGDVIAPGLPIVALMPSPADAPHSSLSYMLGALGAAEFHWDDRARLGARLASIAQGEVPVCLFATAFALLDLFDSSEQCWMLPAGSYLVETGGFKGRTREIGRDELDTLIARRLGIGREHIVAEYGMSEMASQFYDRGRRGYAGPHWLRFRIVDPVTLCDAETGLLRIYDLANWNSVAVIQTQDMARALPDGTFELLGRASGAELRGCSLMVEDRWLTARSGR